MKQFHRATPIVIVIVCLDKDHSKHFPLSESGVTVLKVNCREL